MAEPGAIDADTMKALQSMGHAIKLRDGTWGNLQTVQWDKQANTLSGGTDPRNPVGRAEVRRVVAKP